MNTVYIKNNINVAIQKRHKKASWKYGKNIQRNRKNKCKNFKTKGSPAIQFNLQ